MEEKRHPKKVNRMNFLLHENILSGSKFEKRLAVLVLIDISTTYEVKCPERIKIINSMSVG